MTFHTAKYRTRSAVVAANLVGLLLLMGCVDRARGPAIARSSPSPPGDTVEAAMSPAQESARGDRSQPSSEPPASRTVRLAFGGDVMFEDDLREFLDEPETGLDPIKAATAAADFTMVNLEAALTNRGTRDPKELEDADNRYHFRTGPSALEALHAAGVDAVSVANNHGVDFGAQGLADTLRVKATAPIPVLGVGRDRAEALTPYRVTLRGQQFAFFAADDSFLESTAPHWQAGASTPGLAAARGPGRSALVRAVDRAAAEGAAVVVYLHWGEENSTKATTRQQALAKALAGAGAAAVVGTHSHRLQGAGWLGSTYVSYGLGNFIWYHGRNGATGLLDLTVRDGRVVADSWRPAVIPAAGGLPRFQNGRAAAEATAAWRKLRRGTGLADEPPRASPASPAFKSSVSPITDEIRARMATSHRPGCPVPLADLRYLRLSYWDFDGRVRSGELVIAAEHADDVVAVFRKLYAARFPIQRMVLVSEYGGDDEKSMAANNSSGFNCRTVAGTDRWSQHSFGAAIDLNPVQNPYVTQAGVSPKAGQPYARPGARRATVKGLITADSVVVRAFRDVGWEWGGDWTSPKDYQHFSATGS
ncbi:hypothetical protein MLP_31780 [Microlunatus phosphovorus NM-1]|uniref:Capsule synthesis protein CapA domain-containing protein n=1 Tax=Microlunatus phosphovorus (strain ATCC 700054 / DSM 10555 / JCM 9379 / NBRC 101784 / NCIMB 13414 / VKM Ac-1990 / NM-1) TaxID=1032480 RepID=F5XLC6_MICPN|nr:hypothetical protein MLP_31780 [Microlunatus phosphovorus NM-1]